MAKYSFKECFQRDQDIAEHFCAEFLLK